MSNLQDFWNLNPTEQENIRSMVLPKCSECGMPSANNICIFCDHKICANCLVHEPQNGKHIIACVSCHEAKWIEKAIS